MIYKKIHFWTGIIFFVIFLLSGAYMKWNFPEFAENQFLRMMYRANHIYILFAAIINLIFGFNTFELLKKWSLLYKTGSCLIIIAPFLLLTAFFYEPALQSFNRPFTFLGIVSLSTGVLLLLTVQWLNQRKSI